MTKFLNSPLFFWLLLMVPSIPMISAFYANGGDVGHLLHPTGEFSARFLVITMMISPLRMLFPKAKWLHWLMRRRRYLGVAAFGYALLHLILYVIKMGALQPMLNEFWKLGIWTGWAAFIIFVPLALTSNNLSQRLLLARWKPLQQTVYFAAILTLAHWIFVHNTFGPALVHFAPLAALETYRIWKNMVQKTQVA